MIHPVDFAMHMRSSAHCCPPKLARARNDQATLA